MTIEEKARAYDEALKRAKEQYDIYSNPVLLKYIFPELEESEDKKVRRILREIVLQWKNGHQAWCSDGKEIDAILAWLEKKGKQKPAEHSKEDNVMLNACINVLHAVGHKTLSHWLEKRGEQKSTDKELKFKVGDWIVKDNTVYHVDKILGFYLILSTLDGRTFSYHTGVFDSDKVRLWTTQDAKDGDVLTTLDYILIFKKFLKNNGGISYCHYDFGAWKPQFVWSEDKNWYFGKEAIIHPATKEQRDLLFAKMKEAGYEWDTEKKELKKIEQKPTDWKPNNRQIKALNIAIRCGIQLGTWEETALKSLKEQLIHLKKK